MTPREQADKRAEDRAAQDRAAGDHGTDEHAADGGRAANGARKPARTAAARGSRRAYHHGDLRNALVEAGMELVREGGPDALVLREVARATGVSSTAAYRHFENHGDLVEAVKHEASRAMANRVRAELAATPQSPEPAEEAIRRIAAAGSGYVRFALAEPGLFRLIFRQSKHAGRTALTLAAEELSPAKEGDETYAMMAAALDTLVGEGVLAAERRPFMDIAMWAAVHGISTLLIDTGLAQLPDPAREAVIKRSFDAVFHGIVPPDRATPWSD